MNFPDNVKYTKDHEWVRIEGENAYVGITDFAQGELGDIVYIDIPSAASSLTKEEVFGTIEAVKTVSDLFMPVSGEITEINQEINNQADLVNSDPYGKGWLIKVKMSNPTELSDLLDSSAYRNLIGH